MTDAINGAGAAEPLLATLGLCRHFGGLRAVDDVSFQLFPGELHAVIGPNGAGKSTFINLLSGDLPPSAGRILLGGQPITGLPAWRISRLGIGRSYQKTNIFGPLSLLENVRLAAQAQMPRAPGGVIRLLRPAAGAAGPIARAREALARVGLQDLDAGRPAASLSHGQRRQLEIAMTLAGQPRLLLLDEPLAGMGPEESERMAALLRQLARDCAVLLVEHDMDVVFAVADRLTVLVDGRILAQGDAATVRSDPAVRAAYLGAEQEVAP